MPLDLNSAIEYLSYHFLLNILIYSPYLLEPSKAPSISCSATQTNVIQCQTTHIHADDWNGVPHSYEFLHRPVRYISEEQLEMDVTLWNLTE